MLSSSAAGFRAHSDCPKVWRFPSSPAWRPSTPAGSPPVFPCASTPTRVFKVRDGRSPLPAARSSTRPCRCRRQADVDALPARRVGREARARAERSDERKQRARPAFRLLPLRPERHGRPDCAERRGRRFGSGPVPALCLGGFWGETKENYRDKRNNRNGCRTLPEFCANGSHFLNMRAVGGSHAPGGSIAALAARTGSWCRGGMVARWRRLVLWGGGDRGMEAG